MASTRTSSGTESPVSGGGMGVTGVSCGAGNPSQTFCCPGGCGGRVSVGETVVDGVGEYVAVGEPDGTGDGSGEGVGKAIAQAVRNSRAASGSASRTRAFRGTVPGGSASCVRARLPRVSRGIQDLGSIPLIIAADCKSGGNHTGRS